MTDTSLLDPSAIEALRSLGPDGDPSFLKELIDIFLQDTPERVAELESALARSDAPLAMRAAHTIKGSSSNFGAARLAQQAQRIEVHCKAGDCAAALGLVAGLKAEYGLVATELARLGAA